MITKVLVADDTVVFRRAISGAFAGMPGVEVVGTASNGKLALSKIAALQPDLVTLDIEMPEMNGLEVLAAMGAAGLKACVLVISSHTARGRDMTIRALELGAFDCLMKPEGGSLEANVAALRDRLLPLVRGFQRQQEIRSILKANSPAAELRPAPPVRMVSNALPGPPRFPARSGPPIVLIGVSTGGPAALAALLPAFPADLGAPVFIVQHIPPLFTQPLAARLAEKSALAVKEAQDGESARANCAYLAPGGKQMKLTPGPQSQIIVRVTDDPAENNCKPAVDYLFRSAAMQFPGRSVAAILTGMGNDGTTGLRLLKRSGCYAIAQDEASCVVFGMPKEAIHAGVIDTVLPLNQIAGAIARSVRESGA